VPAVPQGQQEPTANPAISSATNRITSAGYVYDLAGNLTNKPGFTYGYDAENRMTNADNGQALGQSSYAYDGEGKRVKKVTASGSSATVFVYDAGGKLVAEYASAPPQANGTQYLTADNLGTPRVVTNAQRNVVSRHDYLPFGEELQAGTGGRAMGQGYSGADNVRQKFTGHERDSETGLDYMKARYYSSAQGRFTSADKPFADQRQTNPQSWNLFAYVRNSPCNNVDPSGRCSAPSGLKAGSVGICVEAFIAAPHIGPGGIGHGDGRTFDGNNPNLTNRVQVQITLTANKEGVSGTYNTRAGVSVATIGVGTVSDHDKSTGVTEVAENTIGLQGTASAKVNGTYTRQAGAEDFGTTMLNVEGTGKNGFQATGQALQLSPDVGTKVAGAVIEAASPAGTIDFNMNFKITGSGQVEWAGGQVKGYPSYAVYSYTVGASGNVQTNPI
jgi:RHS repeat-associated protein